MYQFIGITKLKKSSKKEILLGIVDMIEEHKENDTKYYNLFNFHEFSTIEGFSAEMLDKILYYKTKHERMLLDNPRLRGFINLIH
jgi:endonuclease III-like uncharacterized protein